jgi:hypothetical protein
MMGVLAKLWSVCGLDLCFPLTGGFRFVLGRNSDFVFGAVFGSHRVVGDWGENCGCGCGCGCGCCFNILFSSESSVWSKPKRCVRIVVVV